MALLFSYQLALLLSFTNRPETHTLYWIISSSCLLHILDEYNVLSLPCTEVTWRPPMTGYSVLFVTCITACWPSCHFLCSWFQRANPHRCRQICVFLELQVFINSSLWSRICFSWGILRLQTSGYRFDAIVLLWCISLGWFWLKLMERCTKLTLMVVVIYYLENQSR